MTNFFTDQISCRLFFTPTFFFTDKVGYLNKHFMHLGCVYLKKKRSAILFLYEDQDVGGSSSEIKYSRVDKVNFVENSKILIIFADNIGSDLVRFEHIFCFSKTEGSILP